jgi:hypothetical protein
MKTIEISDDIYSEFQYICQLLKENRALKFDLYDTPEKIISHVLSSIADGSRRPGSNERGMLENLGLVADCDEHQVYRQTYGKPDINDKAETIVA